MTIQKTQSADEQSKEISLEVNKAGSNRRETEKKEEKFSKKIKILKRLKQILEIKVSFNQNTSKKSIITDMTKKNEFQE